MLPFLLLLALTVIPAASAQDFPYTLKVDVSMVAVDIAVFDDSGRAVTGLSKQDFIIYEDGRRQVIQTFASTNTGYNMLLVIDRSGSMMQAFPTLIQAVNRFLSNLRVQDRFSLATFDRSVQRLINWRSVRAGSKKTVNLGAGGGTDFYSALNWAANDLRKIRGRRAVLFYTDGEDDLLYDPEAEAKTLPRILQNVRRTNAPFHFVGLGANPERTAGALLKKIAEETGGQAYFPQNLDEIIPLYDRISRELGSSYTLGYLSDKPELDGTQRRIEVVLPDRNYRISQSRTSYRAN